MKSLARTSPCRGDWRQDRFLAPVGASLLRTADAVMDGEEQRRPAGGPAAWCGVGEGGGGGYWENEKYRVRP
ncbi:hypothetical protein GCM10027074_60780 [Streptomyces deserti]